MHHSGCVGVLLSRPEDGISTVILAQLIAFLIKKKGFMVKKYLTNRMYFYMTCMFLEGFPGGPDSKESACNAGDPGWIPGLGRMFWRMK